MFKVSKLSSFNRPQKQDFPISRKEMDGQDSIEKTIPSVGLF